MAMIQNVTEVDNLIRINLVIVSCTNKTGLISDAGVNIPGFPKNGIIGRITELNPGVQFISTGETYNIIKKADYNVIEMGVYTGYPEMKTGLVKSLHPKIHAGILGHLKTADDFEFMREHGVPAIDAVIVNFYDLQNAVEGHYDFESIRQAIDIGGPTLCYSSRKAFISTAVMASIESYLLFLTDIEKHHGCVSLSCRLKLAKETSSIYTKLMQSVDSIFQNVDFDELTNCYHIN